MLSENQLEEFFKWKDSNPNSKEILSELCKRCQKCCKEVAIESQYPYCDEVIEFYEARGFEVKVGSNNCAFISAKIPCPHLTDSGCNIYNNRPKTCQDFNGLIDFNGDCLWMEVFEKYIKG